MIAPTTMDVLARVARVLGFELRPAERAIPIGVDYELAQGQPQYALLRGDQVEFDGTARECSAFLIGWRESVRAMAGAGAREPRAATAAHSVFADVREVVSMGLKNVDLDVDPLAKHITAEVVLRLVRRWLLTEDEANALRGCVNHAENCHELASGWPAAAGAAHLYTVIERLVGSTAAGAGRQ